MYYNNEDAGDLSAAGAAGASEAAAEEAAAREAKAQTIEYRETRALIQALYRHGWMVYAVDYGAGKMATKTSDDAADLACAAPACDADISSHNSRMYVHHLAGGHRSCLLLVYGNGRGELVADYTRPPDQAAKQSLDAALDDYDSEWMGCR
jgi:hypothetical protein